MSRILNSGWFAGGCSQSSCGAAGYSARPEVHRPGPDAGKSQRLSIGRGYARVSDYPTIRMTLVALKYINERFDGVWEISTEEISIVNQIIEPRPQAEDYTESEPAEPPSEQPAPHTAATRGIPQDATHDPGCRGGCCAFITCTRQPCPPMEACMFTPEHESSPQAAAASIYVHHGPRAGPLQPDHGPHLAEYPVAAGVRCGLSEWGRRFDPYSPRLGGRAQ